jgi:hypothetical protein
MRRGSPPAHKSEFDQGERQDKKPSGPPPKKSGTQKEEGAFDDDREENRLPERSRDVSRDKFAWVAPDTDGDTRNRKSSDQSKSQGEIKEEKSQTSGTDWIHSEQDDHPRDPGSGRSTAHQKKIIAETHTPLEVLEKKLKIFSPIC